MLDALQRASIAWISLEALPYGAWQGDARVSAFSSNRPLDWGTYSCGDVVPVPSQRQAASQCGGCSRLKAAGTVVSINNDSGVACKQPARAKDVGGAVVAVP